MFVISENHVKKAISAVGGPTKSSNLLGVSNGTIHQWVRLGRVSNIDFARRLSQLSGVALDKLRPV